MKTLSTYKTILALFIIATISCQDELKFSDDAIQQVNEDFDVTDNKLEVYNLWSRLSNTKPRYDGSDSGPIDRLKAQAWIENFNKVATTGGIMSHYFDRETLEKILNEKGCTGLRLHHAVDDYGRKDVVINGVNNQGNTIHTITMVSTSPIEYGKSTKIIGEIDETSAKAWIDNYTSKAAPDQIRSHYFGQNIIRKILEEEGCVGIRVYYALTENFENKLIIIGTDNDGNDLMPRSSTVNAGENVIADFSFPCPSVCPK